MRRCPLRSLDPRVFGGQKKKTKITAPSLSCASWTDLYWMAKYLRCAENGGAYGEKEKQIQAQYWHVSHFQGDVLLVLWIYDL